MDYEYDIDIGDVVKLNDGDIYEVTGVIHDEGKVYFFQGESKVFVFFSQIDKLYKPETK